MLQPTTNGSQRFKDSASDRRLGRSACGRSSLSSGSSTCHRVARLRVRQALDFRRFFGRQINCFAHDPWTIIASRSADVVLNLPRRSFVKTDLKESMRWSSKFTRKSTWENDPNLFLFLTPQIKSEMYACCCRDTNWCESSEVTKPSCK